MALLHCVYRVFHRVSFWQGVGTVVSGTALQGVIRLNDPMLLGPDSTGSFTRIVIKSIHRKRMPVKEVRGGQTASFALKKVGTCMCAFVQLALKTCLHHDSIMTS